MNELRPWPPGQRPRPDFPRFGLTQYAARFPRDASSRRLQVGGAVELPLDLEDATSGLTRVEQVSDFHCVTTWSCPGLRWSGFRMAELLPRLQQQARAHPQSKWLLLRAQDGYRNALLLEDLLAPDVLLADRLNGEPLTVAHGAPWRLVAPAHYGYKSVKHVKGLDFSVEAPALKPAWLRFMNHPRGRVALEERGRGLPGWLLRGLYRPLVVPTAAYFKRALATAGRSG